MIIEHSGDFKVVDPKTKEVRYDSTDVSLNLSSMNSSTWYINEGNLKTEVTGLGHLEKTTSTKSQILDSLKGKTFEDIHRILDEVFEEVKIKAKY